MAQVWGHTLTSVAPTQYQPIICAHPSGPYVCTSGCTGPPPAGFNCKLMRFGQKAPDDAGSIHWQAAIDDRGCTSPPQAVPAAGAEQVPASRPAAEPHMPLLQTSPQQRALGRQG